MTDIADAARRIFAKVKSAPMPIPTYASFSKGSSASVGNDAAFVPDQCYFNLMLNEIFLKDGRDWWSLFNPSVYVNVDFVYGAERLSVPSIVGPATFKGKEQLPHGFLMSDINVVGPHPFRGDRIGITLVLYRVKTTDYAKSTLNFAESVSSAIGVPADMNMVAKCGSTVLSALETLVNMNDCNPVIGHRIELSRAIGLEPSYHALISGKVDLENLKVVGNKLLYKNGDRLQDDYVLYSIFSSRKREEIRTLDFYKSIAVLDAASLSNDEKGWERAKSAVITIYQEMIASPDLIGSQAEEVFGELIERMKRNKGTGERVRMMGEHGAFFGDAFTGRANNALSTIQQLR
jgi:hypothetical protein